MNKDNLKQELKALIIYECDKEDDISVDDIDDLDPLIGDGSIELDSLDSLQISLAIKKKYKVRIQGAKEGRKAFASINALADFIINKSQ